MTAPALFSVNGKTTLSAVHVAWMTNLRSYAQSMVLYPVLSCKPLIVTLFLLACSMNVAAIAWIAGIAIVRFVTDTLRRLSQAL